MTKEYKEIPCEQCGKMVNEHHAAQKKHASECINKPAESPVMNEIKTVEKATTEAPTFKDEAAKELWKVSQSAKETRKQSPELFVTGVHTDERKELIKRYAPECVDPLYSPSSRKKRLFAEWHAFWGDPEKAMIHAHRGYEPVPNEHGQQVSHKGDLLFRIPRSMWLDVKLAVSRESNARRKRADNEDVEKLKQSAGAGVKITATREEIIE